MFVHCCVWLLLYVLWGGYFAVVWVCVCMYVLFVCCLPVFVLEVVCVCLGVLACLCAVCACLLLVCVCLNVLLRGFVCVLVFGRVCVFSCSCVRLCLVCL